LRDQPSARVAGRFVALWLTIFFLCRLYVTFSAESLPPLPKLCLGKALTLNPGYLPARLKAAECIDSYRAACKLFPEFGAAYYALALAYRTIEEEEKAREEFQNYERSKDTGLPARDPLLEEMHGLNRSATIQIRAGFDLERAGKLQEASEARWTQWVTSNFLGAVRV
jgi:hypothetical protein